MRKWVVVVSPCKQRYIYQYYRGSVIHIYENRVGSRVSLEYIIEVEKLEDRSAAEGLNDNVCEQLPLC